MLLGACNRSDFEHKFDQLPDERLQTNISNLKQILIGAEHGWLMTYFMGDDIEYAIYSIARFNDNQTVGLLSAEIEEETVSEYTILAEADLELVFNTYNSNLTAYARPNQMRPNGYGTDIEFNVVSVQADRIELEGKVYKGKIYLRKASEAENDLSILPINVERLNKQRTARYMALTITKGLGATADHPKQIGMDCSTYARVAEVSFNHEGAFTQTRKNIFFTHDGFGLSSPVEIGKDSIQYFKYNEAEERYELDHPTMEGYLNCAKLPVYFVAGMYDELMDHFSMKLTRASGKMWDTYIAMKKANMNIKSFVVTTDYKRRIPLFDEDGNPVIDDGNMHDYELGDHLGEGFLFSFHAYEQFYFYYVPMEVQKIEEDRVRFIRKEGEFCTEDKTDPTIGTTIKNSPEFQAFVNYLCNEEGWLIQKTQEYGIIDFDFYSLENPDNYFYSRLY